jgi:hypothetical protein
MDVLNLFSNNSINISIKEGLITAVKDTKNSHFNAGAIQMNDNNTSTFINSSTIILTNNNNSTTLFSQGFTVGDKTTLWSSLTQIGESGLQGVKGDTGLQGAKGDTGLQGAKGDTGLQGAKGDTGLQGESGVQGVKGDTGLQGESGTNDIFINEVYNPKIDELTVGLTNRIYSIIVEGEVNRSRRLVWTCGAFPIDGPFGIPFARGTDILSAMGTTQFNDSLNIPRGGLVKMIVPLVDYNFMDDQTPNPISTLDFSLVGNSLKLYKVGVGVNIGLSLTKGSFLSFGNGYANTEDGVTYLDSENQPYVPPIGMRVRISLECFVKEGLIP